jgi:hypothetical protein
MSPLVECTLPSPVPILVGHQANCLQLAPESHQVLYFLRRPVLNQAVDRVGCHRVYQVLHQALHHSRLPALCLLHLQQSIQVLLQVKHRPRILVYLQIGRRVSNHLFGQVLFQQVFLAYRQVHTRVGTQLVDLVCFQR